MIRFRIFFCITLFSFSFLHSQNKIHIPGPDSLSVNRQNIFNEFKDDINSGLNTGVGFLESPLHFDSGDFLLSGVIISATALSVSLDNSIRNKVKTFHSKSLDDITLIGEKFGNGRYGMALSGVLYLGGHLINDAELRKTGLILAEVILLNGMITQGLKMTTGRSRPFTNEGNMKVDFPTFELNGEGHSFPSGHTSTAFAIATVLSERVKNFYFSAAIYSLAGLTAFQRIYNDNHWISDIVFGAALGTVIGLKVVKLNNDDEDSGNLKLTFLPLLNYNSYGLGAVINL